MAIADRVTLDSVLEDESNAPIELSQTGTYGSFLLEQSYPPPEIESTWASSADSEGESLIQNRPQNRQITLQCRLLEPPGAAAINLAPNPSFEKGLTGWGVTQGGWASSGLSRVTPTFYSGGGDYSALVKATKDATATQQIGFISQSGLGPNLCPVTAGRSYSLAVPLNVTDAPATGVRAYVQWLNASLVGVGISGVSTFQNTTGERVHEVLNQTAPATAAFAVINVQFVSSVSGDTVEFEVDAALMTEGATVPAYFDGDSLGCEWLGGRHESASRALASGGERFQGMQADLTQACSKINREGGTLTRSLKEGASITFDLLSAKVEFTDDKRSHLGIGTATFTFTAKPHGREPEVELAVHTEVSNPALVFTESEIRGDVPALGRVRVTDTQGQDQWTALVGLESSYLSTSAGAEPFYQAETRTALGTATIGEVTLGGSTATAVQGDLTPFYSAVMSTDTAPGGNHLSHTGEFRVYARLGRPVANTGAVSVLFEWGQGDLTRMTRNSAVSYGVGEREGAWTIADLGSVSLTPTLNGDAQSWVGRIVANSTVLGDDLYVDWLLLVPTTDGYGKIETKPQYEIPSAVTVRDGFNGSEAALNGTALVAVLASAGPNNAGTVANTTGAGTLEWTNVAGGKAPDSEYAVATIPTPGAYSTNWLKATNFGFAIPTGATIKGVVARVQRSALNNSGEGSKGVEDLAMCVVKGGTIKTEQDKHRSGWWPTTDAYQTYGSASDLWGQTWAYTDINATTFGVALRCEIRNFSGGEQARVNSVQLTVYYVDATGQSWATTGDAVDIKVIEASHTAQRTEVSDADINTGRYAAAGTTSYTNSFVGVDIKRSAVSEVSGDVIRQGLLARYSSTSNWLFAGVEDTLNSGSSSYKVLVVKRVSGTPTVLASANVPKNEFTWRSLWLKVDPSGRYAFWMGNQYSYNPALLLVGIDSDLATGGELASGKLGFYDAKTGSHACTRNYDNFTGFIPTNNAAVFSNLSAEIRWDGVVRQDATGTTWGAPMRYTGTNFRIPVSGREGRKLRTVVKLSRGDIETMTDPAVDDVQAQIFYTPLWLHMPG